jgi:hypothetical protein
MGRIAPDPDGSPSELLASWEQACAADPLGGLIEVIPLLEQERAHRDKKRRLR